MPTRYFMKLGSGKDSIAGPCREPNHVGWVELESVQLGLPRHATAPSDKPGDVREIVVTKFEDDASPVLQKMSQYAPALSSVTIDFTDSTTNLPRLRLELHEVLITGFAVSGPGGDRPADSFSLGFTSMQWNNNPAADDMWQRLKQIFPILQ